MDSYLKAIAFSSILTLKLYNQTWQSKYCRIRAMSCRYLTMEIQL